MPSSLTPPAPSQPESQPALLALLASVPDPRDPRGVRYALPVLLAVAITAVLAGARSFTAIGEWAADQGAGVLAGLGVRALARPDESTIRRAFARLDGDRLDAVIGAWMWTRTRVVAGRRVIALDGKTVRGARSRRPGTDSAPHLVAAFDHSGVLVTVLSPAPMESLLGQAVFPSLSYGVASFALDAEPRSAAA